MTLHYTPVEQRPRTIISDIDGCIFKQDWPGMIVEPRDDVLPGVVEKFAEWYTNGDHIILVTARPWAYKAKTEWQLRQAGILYHDLVMGLPTGVRFLINDTKPEQSDRPCAVAINIARDTGFEDIEI